MIKVTIFPMTNPRMRPVFWGVDRDLKEVIESMENAWVGKNQNPKHEFKGNDQTYFLSIDLPGVSQSNIDIHLEEETLSITAVRKGGIADSEEKERTISQKYLLPKNVDTDKIQAHCEDGVLYIALPKLEKARPKKIEISNISDNPSWKDIIGNSIFKGVENRTPLLA